MSIAVEENRDDDSHRYGQSASGAPNDRVDRLFVRLWGQAVTLECDGISQDFTAQKASGRAVPVPGVETGTATLFRASLGVEIDRRLVRLAPV